MKNKIIILLICLMFLTACGDASYLLGVSEKFINAKFVQVVSRESFSYYLDESGNLFTKGGDPDWIESKYAFDEDGVFLKNIKSVSISPGNASAISENNELYFWSFKEERTFIFLDSFKLKKKLNSPQIILNDIVMMINNGNHIMTMIDTKNRLLLVGIYYDGNKYSVDNPLVIDEDVVDMYMGDDYLIYIKKDGSMYGVGNNHRPIISDTDTKLLTTPTKMNISDHIVSIEGNGDSIMIEDIYGSVYFFGEKFSEIDLLNNEKNSNNSSYIAIENKIEISRNVIDYDIRTGSFIIVDSKGECRFWGFLGFPGEYKIPFMEEQVLATQFLNLPEEDKIPYQGKTIANNIKYCYLTQNNNVVLLNDEGKSMSWGLLDGFDGLGNSIKNKDDIPNNKILVFDETPQTWQKE